MSHGRQRRRVLKWVGIAATILGALRLFLVQELIAALIIFSTVFAFMAVVLATATLLAHAAEGSVLWVGTFIRAFGNVVRRGWDNAEPIFIGQRFLNPGAIHARRSNHR
jgi:energy-converting hydrogenase Eha subunit C